MGGGSYSNEARTSRAIDMGYYTKSNSENFKSRSIDNEMDPSQALLRESRDSEEHPNSLAIILGLDVTGSMGEIPSHLVRDGLPTIMGNIIERGIKDPQLLFLGIGDHECDKAPLQVGQFESSDELLDHWLTKVYLEGGGGGNGGESYLLAWYYAAKHTSIDCFEKRKQKGFLFTIGDEPALRNVPSGFLKKTMKKGEFKDYSAAELIGLAKEKYEVFHIHVEHGNPCGDNWKQLLGNNFIIVSTPQEAVDKIIAIVTEGKKTVESSPVSAKEGIIL